jgi:hypothetical protein
VNCDDVGTNLDGKRDERFVVIEYSLKKQIIGNEEGDGFVRCMQREIAAGLI